MSRSLSSCCESLYREPISRDKLLIIGGGLLATLVVGGVLILILSGGDSNHSFKGSDALTITPLIVSENAFPAHLKELLNNQINGFNFSSISNNTGTTWQGCKNCQTDLIRLKQGMVGNQVWTLTTSCDSAYKDAVSLMIEQIDTIKRLLNENSDNIELVYDSRGVIESFKRNTLSTLLAIKGGHTIDSRFPVLRTYYNLGVRSMSLVTSSCVQATTPSPPWYKPGNDASLTDFGWSVVQEMNRLGMIIDISQLSTSSQLGVLSTSKAPVIISNANAYAKCSIDGNVEDSVLAKLKEKGGVILVSFDPALIVGKERVNDGKLEDLITHINYIRDTIGPESIGIAAGFDGFTGTIKGLEDSSKFPALFDALASPSDKDNHTWSSKELQGLAGNNFLRVFDKVEQVAQLLLNTTAVESYEKVIDFLNTTLGCYSDRYKKTGI